MHPETGTQKRADLRHPKQPRRFTRRQFLKLGSAAVAAGVVLSSTSLVLANEVGELSIERIELPIRGLPPAFEGFTIVHLTDIHLLPYTRPAFIREVAATANALNPDLILLTGDYVWHDVRAMDELAPIMATLNARAGVFGVLGNHDYWLDVEAVREGFRQARVPLLVNQHLVLARGRQHLVLVGLDDGWAGHPDLVTALDGAPANAPILLMLHEPDLADVYAAQANFALQMAGHSHGGQVRIPGKGALVLPYLGSKYDMGLYRVGDMWLYTNRGLGEIAIPLRINCPPELTLFTLIRA